MPKSECAQASQASTNSAFCPFEINESTKSFLKASGILGGVAASALALGDYTAGTINQKLLRRVTYGPTEGDQAEINSQGYNTYLNRQLNYATINDNMCEGMVRRRYRRVSMSVSQLRNFEDDWITGEQLREATIYRALKSKRQLYTRMVEFWTDHFNVSMDKPGPWLMVPYHNLIRKHALGKFKDLLKAVAHSPAMLLYLDNVDNYGDFGNVNYARELMELHTITVAGGYTPEDIRNVQRAFSGWEMYWEGSRKGQFRYDRHKHSTLPKVFLGTPIPGNGGGGQNEGEWILDRLASHPSTALAISRKLLKFFLGYSPSEALVNSIASVFLASGGNIKTVVKAVLSQDNVGAIQPKLKRPYHLIISGMRALSANFEQDAWTLKYEYIDRAGQMPFAWEPPDGYPDRPDFWSNLLLPRWNFAFSLPRGYIWGVHVDLMRVLRGARTPEEIANRIDKIAFLNMMEANQKAMLLQFLQSGELLEERIEAAFALALSSPHFQWF